MNTSQVNKVQNTSFEELFLDKIKSVKKSAQKKPCNINLSAAVISNPKLLLQLEDKEIEKGKVGDLWKKRGAKTHEKSRMIIMMNNDDDDDNSEDHDNDCKFTSIQEPKISQMLEKFYMQLGRAWHHQ